MRKTTAYHSFKATLISILVLCISVLNGNGQVFNPVSIDGLSTGSVYDLLADNRGFIWVAHETGISRYDGNNFTNFHSDDQTSLATTDIIEDKQGRIWCHNFNGQLFYIEHEKMTLLKAYDNTKEKSFQRLVLLGDELLATSDKGLFICNTSNLQCHNVTCKNTESNYIRTVAVSGNKAIALGDKWFRYERKTGLHLLKADSSFKNHAIYLQPLITKDTIYAIEIYEGHWCASKLLVRNDSVIVSNRICHSNRINTITQDRGQIFINTNPQTELIDGSPIITGFDLTDRVTDRQGNYWYGSLQKGLLFQRHIGTWEKIEFPEVKQGDYIRSLANAKGTLICGTNNGYIFSKNIKTGKTEIKLQLPRVFGPVLNLFWYGNNMVIVAPSLGLNLFNTDNGRFASIAGTGTIKKIAASDSSIFLAYSDSLTSFPITSSLAKLFKENSKVDMDEVVSDYNRMKMQEKTLRRKRCRYVCYSKETKTVYASFLDGLFSLHHGNFHLLQYKNEPANALSVIESTTKTIMSSLKGIFYLDGDSVVPLTQINQFKSDAVTSLKTHKQYLFLIENDKLQVADIQTETLLSTIPLPDNYNGLIYNIELVGDKLYLANASGLYSINFKSLQENQEAPPVNYLLSVTADNRNITLDNDVNLRYTENNLTFTFAAPNYIFPKHTTFYYKLKGSNDTTWQKMKEAEFLLSFASLKPGDYTLNAYAVDYRKLKANPISFHFIINKPWWQRAWFLALVFAFVITGLYFSLLYRFQLIRKRAREKDLHQRKFETQLLQSQIAVQEQERKRIAEDLHDDIGATLSALHLHISNMPEHTLQRLPELQQFYQQSLLLASKASNDVRGISHDLLPKDFSELGLFAVLQNRINELNATNSIQFTFITDGDEKKLNNIYSITIYRIINEIISNIIKHSQAQQAFIQVLITDAETQIIAEDNGIGIHTIQAKRGIGMKNIQSRISFLKGKMHVDSSEKGTVIIISIPIEQTSKN